MEDAIAALWSSFSNTAGTSASDVQDSDIRTAIQTLAENDVPMDDTNDVAFFLHPRTVWGQVQAIDKFSLLQNTEGADPVLRGHVGFLYGKMSAVLKSSLNNGELLVQNVLRGTIPLYANA